MYSIIITSHNITERDEYALQFCKDKKISGFDITKIDINPDEKKNSIGIEDIRVIQKSLLLRPIQGDKKAIIISNAHTLTIEAQNALLKILEEPPVHTTILLTLPQKDLLLSTICSRCQIIELATVQKALLKDEKDQLQKIIVDLPTFSIPARLKHAQDIAKNKDEALVWLEKSIQVTRSILLEEIKEKNRVEENYLQLLPRLQKAYTLISSTNTNPRLVLENTFVSL